MKEQLQDVESETPSIVEEIDLDEFARLCTLLEQPETQKG